MTSHIKNATPPQLKTPAPRGFRLVEVGSRIVYVRLGYRAEKCDGEAHSNPHIDHCMTCLTGVWGIKAVKTAGDK